MIKYQFFPRSMEITTELENVVNCFNEITDDIDSKNNQLSSNDVLGKVEPSLTKNGYTVETGKKSEQKIQVPVLFGLNNKYDKYFYVDAISEDKHIVIEVEAGQALSNFRFLKDIFETCMMQGVEYLVIAVRNIYKYKSGNSHIESKDFDKIHTFIETLYSSNRMQLPLKGILLIGY